MDQSIASPCASAQREWRPSGIISWPDNYLLCANEQPFVKSVRKEMWRNRYNLLSTLDT